MFKVTLDGQEVNTFEYESEAQTEALMLADDLIADHGYKFASSTQQGDTHTRVYRKGMADKITITVRSTE